MIIWLLQYDRNWSKNERYSIDSHFQCYNNLMPLVKPESKPLVDISSTSSDESDDDSEMIKGTEESYLLAIPF